MTNYVELYADTARKDDEKAKNKYSEKLPVVVLTSFIIAFANKMI